MRKNWLSSAPTLDASANPGQRLVWACFKNDVDAVRALVAEHGDGILLRGSLTSGKPIHAAASEGGVEIVKMILGAGEDVDASGASGTALHYAAEASKLAVVQLLVERGANVNSLRAGMTPVMSCVSKSWCDPSVVLYLIERGADTSWHYRDIEGRDFIRMVLERDNAAVFVALAKAGYLEKGASEPAMEFALGKAQMSNAAIPAIAKACLDDAELCGPCDAAYLRELAQYESTESVRSLLLSKATEVALVDATGVASDADSGAAASQVQSRKTVGGMSL
jgi:hypothetical protein